MMTSSTLVERYIVSIMSFFGKVYNDVISASGQRDDVMLVSQGVDVISSER